MVYVNDAICNGCGECIDICPTNALIFQNNRAFIDQDLCQECGVCIDICPKGAILLAQPLPVGREVIQVPATPPDYSTSLVNCAERVPVREMVLPVIGSVLLWTGRELVPRLADLALGILDRRIQSSQSAPTQKVGMQSNRQVSTSTRGDSRGRRRRQRRRNNRWD
jgi:ferredoxin